MGKAVKRVGLGVATGGLSEVVGGGGGLKDMLFGKKDPGSAARTMYLLDPRARETAALTGKMQREQVRGIGSMINKYKSMDPSQLAKGRVSRMEREQRAAGEMARRQARQLVAQRGLGRSAAGIGAIMASDKGTAQRMLQARAMRSQLEAQFRQQKLAGLAGIGSSLRGTYSGLGTGLVHQRARASRGRTGGIGNLLLAGGGAAVGGMMGGPQGASAGMQMGTGLGQMMQQY